MINALDLEREDLLLFLLFSFNLFPSGEYSTVKPRKNRLNIEKEERRVEGNSDVLRP